MSCTEKEKNTRNYQLDFLKLIFSLFVFISHTDIFIGQTDSLPRERIIWFGEMAVSFFFITTGMLMVNSINKSDISALSSPGKSTIHFVIRKMKPWFFSVISAIILLFIYVKIRHNFNMLDIVIRSIPEMLMCYEGAPAQLINSPSWYLSAMFIMMTPLAFLLYSKKDFTVHVFAPVSAVLLWGYMCQTNNYNFGAAGKLHGFILGGLIFAAFGLCFGICAWTIYNRIDTGLLKTQRLFFTAAEVILWAIYFYAILFTDDNKVKMSAQFVLPVAVAIVFSKRSYIVELFRFSWMRCFGKLSLLVYLNHLVAKCIVRDNFMDLGYKRCVMLMALLTVGFCLASYIIEKLLKLIWKKAAKRLTAN